MDHKIMLIAGFALWLCACSDSGKGDAAAPAATAAGVVDFQDLDACNLVSSEELAGIFSGRSFAVDDSNPAPRSRKGGPDENSFTSCTFITADLSPSEMMAVTVLVTIAPGDDRQQSIQAMKSGVTGLGLGAMPVDVPGLGDGAYWANLGSDRRSAVAVNVKHDPRIWLTVSESSSGQEVGLTVERLTGVAQRVLERL